MLGRLFRPIPSLVEAYQSSKSLLSVGGLQPQNPDQLGIALQQHLFRLRVSTLASQAPTEKTSRVLHAPVALRERGLEDLQRFASLLRCRLSKLRIDFFDSLRRFIGFIGMCRNFVAARAVVLKGKTTIMSSSIYAVSRICLHKDSDLLTVSQASRE